MERVQNTKDTANELRQQDKFTQKVASGNWKSITAKDLQEHGVSNPEEARDQLEASYSENDPENWVAWLRITNSDVEELINRFSANSALDNDASSMLEYLWMYDNIKDDRTSEDLLSIID